MSSDFAGSTTEHYRRYRRDVPAVVLDQVCTRLGVRPDDPVLDLGTGTGQVAVPLASRVGSVLAVDPEPDMLVQLRRRLSAEQVANVVCVLGSDADLPALSGAVPVGFGAVTVGNALHWMDAAAVFASCARVLRPGGGLAVITSGQPLWLAEQEWTRALRTHLETWTGPLRSTCGTDGHTLEQRSAQLQRTGFDDVSVLEHRDQVQLDVEHVIGHLYSAMSQDQVPSSPRAEFETGLRTALQPHEHDLVEDVTMTVLLGRLG